ncbi:MAG: type II secretion system F family protein [Parcubacteria group bacterium]|nr:type II secretion system F family protein [Parcubacteria group bacterium]
MALFEYKGQDTHGKFVEGVIDAPALEFAADLLSEQGITVVSLYPRKTSWLAQYLAIDITQRVSYKDIVIFSRQLAVMVGATVPIVKALRILVKQTENVNLKSVISEIADDVEAGMKLSLALSRHPKVFNDFFINMVKSGETSGKLGDVLNFLADQQEKDYDLLSRIQGAMIYPLIIVAGMFIVGAVMMIFVVPQITGLLKEMGVQLPITTRILIAVSDFFVGYWWLILILLAAGAVGARWYLATENGKRMFDYFLLKVPIFNKIFQRIYLVRFTRSLATLIVGKVPLTVSLQVVAGIVQNRIYKDLIEQTIKEVEDGNSISTVFNKSPEIPMMVSNMLAVGEQTGRIDEVLQRLTDFYSRELDNLVGNLVSLIQPLILIVIGVGIGVMVFAILMPMFQAAGQF